MIYIYVQIFEPGYKYLYLSSNHLLYLGTNATYKSFEDISKSFVPR